jgi:hypothetical protein
MEHATEYMISRFKEQKERLRGEIGVGECRLSEADDCMHYGRDRGEVPVENCETSASFGGADKWPTLRCRPAATLCLIEHSLR